MRRFIIAGALLALAGALLFWVYGPGDDGAEGRVHVVRWGNVTVSVPEGSGVTVAREFEGPEINPPSGGPVLLLAKGESRLLIDADTGEVLLDLVGDADRPAIQQVFATLVASTQDKATGLWPYGGSPPNVPRDGWGRITFIPPDPASGIVVRGEIDDPGGFAIQVTNGRSTLSIDAETGAVFEETTLILPEDEDAFARFLSTVEYLGPPP